MKDLTRWGRDYLQVGKCNSPHIIDADLLMQTIAEVLKKIEDYSISNWGNLKP